MQDIFNTILRKMELQREENCRAAFAAAEKAVLQELLDEANGKECLCEVVAKKYCITTVVQDGGQHG